MRAVVTGAAGFIGSHLSERLLADGHEVTGIDCFTDYYSRTLKEQNLEGLRKNGNFAFHELDLVDGNLGPAFAGVRVVFHLAGQPGVRPSWGRDFDRYVQANLVATQRLLEHLKDSPIDRLVYASSSSVYGDARAFPTKESALPQPVSPYGLTKLAGEHMVMLYMINFGIPAVALRYFTVYGPRQRPDMAFSRFMQALMDRQEIQVFGDGEQSREFTYVSDAVDGTDQPWRREQRDPESSAGYPRGDQSSQSLTAQPACCSGRSTTYRGVNQRRPAAAGLGAEGIASGRVGRAVVLVLPPGRRNYWSSRASRCLGAYPEREVADRRRYPRVQADVFCRPAGADLFHHRRNTQNISLGGMRVFTDEDFAVGTRLDIDVLLPDSTSVRCWAQVVWRIELDGNSPARFDAGLKFLDMASQDVQRLASVLVPTSTET